MNSEIKHLHDLAAQSASYLGETSRGAISAVHRHNSIYALNGLSRVAAKQQREITNLTATVNAQAARIVALAGMLSDAKLDVMKYEAEDASRGRTNMKPQEDEDEIIEHSDDITIQAENMTLEVVNDSEDINKKVDKAEDSHKEVCEQFGQTIAALQEQRDEIDHTFILELMRSRASYEEELEVIRAREAVLIEAKKNAHRLLLTILEFALSQPDGLIGHMSRVYGVIVSDVEMIRQLVEEIRENGDLEFRNNGEVMSVIARLEEIRQARERAAQEAANPVAPVPEVRVEELGEEA